MNQTRRDEHFPDMNKGEWGPLGASEGRSHWVWSDWQLLRILLSHQLILSVVSM